MGASKIEWCDSVYNPVTGCTPISPGCAHCWAKRMAETRLRGRFGYDKDDPFKVTLHGDKLGQPLKWRKPRRIFVCSMGDLFHRSVMQGWIDSVFYVMSQTPQHTYMILTKRPDIMAEYVDLSVEDNGCVEIDVGIGACSFQWPLPNVWLGVTVESQKQDWRIRRLLDIPAAVRFVSMEPLLGAVDMRDLPVNSTTHINALTGRERMSGAINGFGTSTGTHLNWIIAGAETGPGARPMDLGWARSIRDQCQAAGVPFFFKRDSDGSRLLYGRQWNEFPRCT